MNIVPYTTFGPLKFGRSSKSDCVSMLGEPKRVRTNHEGVDEFHYDEFIIRFDPSNSTFREGTLLPRTAATIDDLDVTWDHEFLRQACDRDGSPRDVCGFIVLKSLGIAVTGLHDDDEPQLAITAFSKGEFDDLLIESVPFRIFG
jgi:hypothetical protein